MHAISCCQALGTVLGYADAAQAPQEFTTAPALAIPKALAAVGVQPGEVFCYEINEAFSVVDLVNRRLLQLDPERCAPGAWRCNPTPLACSSAYFLLLQIRYLLTEMRSTSTT